MFILRRFFSFKLTLSAAYILNETVVPIIVIYETIIVNVIDVNSGTTLYLYSIWIETWSFPKNET